MTTSIPTADLYDRYIDRPDEIQVLAAGWRCFTGRSTYSGEIATLAPVNSGGAVRLRDTLEQPGNGRVLVVQGGGIDRWAVLGDQLAALGQQHGWSGILINGFVRDTALLRPMDIGVHALGAVPSRPAQFAETLRDTPVSFGKTHFVTGSWLYADEDGIVVCSDRQSAIWTFEREFLD